MYVGVPGNVYASVNAGAQRPTEGVSSLGTTVTDSYELLNMGAGNQTRVFDILKLLIEKKKSPHTLSTHLGLFPMKGAHEFDIRAFPEAALLVWSIRGIPR